MLPAPAVLVVLVVSLVLVPLQPSQPPRRLPAAAVTQLRSSLAAARTHAGHRWRDHAPRSAAGLVRGFIEIARGDRRKFEFDMAANSLRLDRVVSERVGPYPVNYGFVPQTVSYDGDPFDVLVLGPPIASGTMTEGVVVGLMHMEDEKGLDSKVVLSPIDGRGQPRFALTRAERERIAGFFRIYKRDEPGKYSRVPGWGSAAAGLSYVQVTHAFFASCAPASADCVLR
jgi:inorganic pyrophosphatase